MADETPAEGEEVEVVETDEQREELLAQFGEELGDAVIGSHIQPGDDIWVRVARDAWARTAEWLHSGMHCRYFSFLSAIDWMPSPFGRDMDSQVDTIVHGADESDPLEQGSGLAGADTRFQLFARVNNIADGWAVTVKTDIPDDDLAADTWIDTYPGANWHEREVREMFGIHFVGHPDLRNIYLPTGFEGNPLRKDFPLLARQVKPWPGIVDVEGMPGDGDEADEADDAAKADA